MAVNYVAKKMLNIADLTKVSISVETEQRTFKGGTPDAFEVEVAIIDGLEYRVPMSVIAQLQELIKAMPDLKYIKVTKSGEGISGTRYSVIPLRE